MKIKRVNEFSDNGIITKKFPEYLLIIGERSEDMFLYFGVEEMHGLNLKDCRSYNETPTDAYIAGMCNEFPDNPSKFYLFLNNERISGMFSSEAPYDAPLLIMHECMHMSIEVHGTDLSDGELEEKAITWAEEQAREVIKYMESIGRL